jgi:hypothetical protein
VVGEGQAVQGAQAGVPGSVGGHVRVEDQSGDGLAGGRLVGE